jgi:hypothetical protein
LLLLAVVLLGLLLLLVVLVVPAGLLYASTWLHMLLLQDASNGASWLAPRCSWVRPLCNMAAAAAARGVDTQHKQGGACCAAAVAQGCATS